MKYKFDKNIYKKLRRRRKVKLLTLPSALLIGSAYLLLLLVSPMILHVPKSDDGTSHQIPFSAIEAPQIAQSSNRVIIPKIGVDLEFKTGNAAVMDSAVWYRFPDRGAPDKGGNFILSAHRFNLGWTPQQTKAKSPFYHIDKLANGDTIFVDYNGKRYQYEVQKKYSVSPNAVEIEAPTSTAKLTLYSCTLKGANDGRDVIDAVLKQEVITANL